MSVAPTPGFEGLGPVKRIQVEGHRALLQAGHQEVRLEFLADGVVRVLYRPPGAAEDPHSWALAGAPAPGREPEHQHHHGHDDLLGSDLVVRVFHDPARIEVLDRHHRRLFQTTAGGAFAHRGGERLMRLEYPWWEQTFGLGEKTGPMNKQGTVKRMWNTDEPFYEATDDPLYKSVPFWLGLRDGGAYGLLADNAGRLVIDLGVGEREVLSVRASTGEIDLYVVPGFHPHDVLRRYTELTGRPALPPLWALGYQQCRYSYYPDSRVLELARRFRRERIPCDVLYLDIHHMDRYRSFTWDRERFPRPKGFLEELHGEGFKAVGIVDPGLPVDEDYAPYVAAREGGHLVRGPDGTEFRGHVWPGLCAFPDYTRAATREWWGTLYEGLIADGFDGFWNDMNEPAVQQSDDRTLPDDALHESDAGPLPHAAVHNAYGSLMIRATREGVARLRPGRRPFLLSRAAFAGMQRFAATWSGDNRSRFEDLRLSIPMALNMAASGFPLYGPDVGGFSEQPTPELFTRWLQAATYMGLMRVHTSIDTPDQEPWSFGEPWTDHARTAIEQRYRLLPYLYSLVHEAAATGVPLMRPLWMEFPGEYDLAPIEDQFLLGPRLLVAPALEAGVLQREVRLPPGGWFPFEGGDRMVGGRTVTAAAPFDRVPVFAAEGAIVPLQQVVQHVGEQPDPVLTVRVFAGAQGEFVLTEDAGDGPADGSGPVRRTRFALDARDEGRRLVLATDLLEDAWPGRFQFLRYEIRGLTGAPLRVTRNGGPEEAARDDPPGPDDPLGFHWSDGRLEVWAPAGSLPQVLEIGLGTPLPQRPEPPRLRCRPRPERHDLASGPPVDPAALPLLADGVGHLVLHPWWRGEPLPVRGAAFRGDAHVDLWIALCARPGLRLQPSFNFVEDGLLLRWGSADGHARHSVRIGRDERPEAPDGVHAEDAALAAALDAHVERGDDAVVYGVRIPDEHLDPAALDSTEGMALEFEVVHADRGGFRAHMAWVPSGGREHAPAGRLLAR